MHCPRAFDGSGFSPQSPTSTGSQINDTAGFRIYFRFIEVSGSDSTIAERCTADGLAIFQFSVRRIFCFVVFFFFLVCGKRSARRLFYLSRHFFFFFFHFSLVFGFGGFSQCTPNKSNSRFFFPFSLADLSCARMTISLTHLHMCECKHIGLALTLVRRFVRVF